MASFADVENFDASLVRGEDLVGVPVVKTNVVIPGIHGYRPRTWEHEITMNPQLSEKVSATVQRLVEFLVQKNYSEIVRWTRGRRLPEIQIRSAIEEYGCTLIIPPESFYSTIDVIPIEYSKPRQWSIVFPLWTSDEGESDLSVEVTCTDSAGPWLDLELDNIHTL